MFTKLLFAFCLLLIVASFSNAQTGDEKLPPIKLTLTSEKTVWTSGDSGNVKLVIENLGSEDVNIKPGLAFTFADRVYDKGAIRTDKMFWGPVSFTKPYNYSISGCANDLTPDRVSESGIYPAKGTLKLVPSEKREFDFDVLRICWNHVILSDYPNRNLFELLKGYGPAGKYILYTEMGFRTGSLKMSGMEIPIGKSIKSNNVAITIN